MADWEQMARVEEIPPGGRKPVVIDDLPALLIRIGDDFYCIEDTCTHDGAPMTDGAIVGCEIVCPRHGARFDIPSGRVTRMPATEPIRTFPVEVRDGAVFVRPE